LLLNQVSLAAADGASPTWNIGTLEDVFMDVHNTDNYQLDGPQSDLQWEALMPTHDGLVRLGPHKELFMVSMFHQLKCLDIIRRDYVQGSMDHSKTTPVAHHCLNYIRQMILCRGDRRLEWVVDPFAEHSVQIRGTQTCRDWTKVYERVRENEDSI
jgi:hypothetical protein